MGLAQAHSFGLFGLRFSICTMGGGMDSTLIFQDAIDCIYTVLQLVAGDKAYPEKVFQEGKCYIGVAWISLCA